MPQYNRKSKATAKGAYVMLSAAAAMISSRSGGGGIRLATAFSIPSARTTAPRSQFLRSSVLLSSTVSADTEAAADAPALINNRLSRASIPSSLDARSLSDNLDIVLSHLTSRRASDDTLEAAKTVSALNSARVSLIQKRDEALQRRNECSGQVGKLMRETKGEETEEIKSLKEKASQAGEDANTVEKELNEIESKVNTLLASLPNLLDDAVPDGDDEGANELVNEWGDVAALPKELGWTDEFEPLWHDDVATNLGGWNSEAAVGMSGARFVSLTGSVARLERAISSYFLDGFVCNVI